MNHSIHSADRSTHLKIVGVALAAGIAVTALGITARSSVDYTQTARAIKAGTVWTNTWATLSDAFEEGGYKYSGIGRARGLRAMEEFQEVKTQFLAVRALDGSSPHSGTMAP